MVAYGLCTGRNEFAILFWLFIINIASFSYSDRWQMLHSFLNAKFLLWQRWQSQWWSLFLFWTLICWVNSFSDNCFSWGYSQASISCLASKALASLTTWTFLCLFSFVFCFLRAALSCYSKVICSGMPFWSMTVLGFLHRLHSLRPLKL